MHNQRAGGKWGCEKGGKVGCLRGDVHNGGGGFRGREAGAAVLWYIKCSICGKEQKWRGDCKGPGGGEGGDRAGGEKGHEILEDTRDSISNQRQ